MVHVQTIELSEDDEEFDDDSDSVGDWGGVNNRDGVDGDHAGMGINSLNSRGEINDGTVQILLEFVRLKGLLGTLSIFLLLHV